MTQELNRDSARSEVLGSASALVKKFQDNPYRYLYEADLQAELFSSLRQKLTSTFSVEFDASRYDLSHVYLEYQKYGDGRGRLDLAVLDPGLPERPSPSPGSSLEKFLYNLPVWIGIELKYTMIGYKFNIDNGINDLKKLRRHLQSEATKHNGLAIAFLQTDTERVAIRHGVEVQTIDALDCLYIVSPKNLRKVAVAWDLRSEEP